MTTIRIIDGHNVHLFEWEHVPRVGEEVLIPRDLRADGTLMTRAVERVCTAPKMSTIGGSFNGSARRTDFLVVGFNYDTVRAAYFRSNTASRASSGAPANPFSGCCAAIAIPTAPPNLQSTNVARACRRADSLTIVTYLLLS